MNSIIGALHNIGFNWEVALANFVNFLIILWVLKKFAFGPIQKGIDKRRARIADGLKKAEEADEKLAMMKQKKEDVLAEAHKGAQDIIETAYVEKDSIVARAAEEATKKADEIVKRGEERIEIEVFQMKKDFRKYAAELSIAGAEKIVSETLDKEKNEKLVKSILKNND